MGRAKFHCVYCDRYCEDTEEARKRHCSGRNHKANVKLWYDSIQDRQQRQAAATAMQPERHSETASATSVTPAFRWDQLPPSMLPPPPDVFLTQSRQDWG